MKLRAYQKEAVNAGIKALQNETNPSLIVVPTGGGKSYIIAGIAKELDGDVLVLQPTKEILEQNYNKMMMYGFNDVQIYSASFKSKEIGQFTYATIGSIYRKPEEFKHFKYVIVDECNCISPKNIKGMYNKFFEAIGNPKILGLTASPYRLVNKYVRKGNDFFYTGHLQMLNRIYPFFFKKIVYKISIKELIDAGYLSELNYSFPDKEFRSEEIKMNTTGNDFDKESLDNYVNKKNRVEKVVSSVLKYWNDRKHFLIFASSVLQAETISQALLDEGIKNEAVFSNTPTKERERIIKDFRNGDVRVVINVRVLALGFDFPELDCVILCRPTTSLSLFYQMCYTEDMEMLTDKGFVKHNEIKTGDNVYAFDKSNGEIRLVKVWDKIYRDKYSFEKVMQYKSHYLDVGMSDYHDVIYKSHGNGWLKKPLRAVLEHKNNFYVPVSGVEKVKGVDLSDDEIRFLGFFLSDGNYNKRSNVISITQSEHNPEIIKEIKRVLSSCGFKYAVYKKRDDDGGYKSNFSRYDFCVSKGNPRGTQLDKIGWGQKEYLAKYLKANKYLTPAYENFNERQFDLLLDYIYLGDGTKKKTNPNRRHYKISMGCDLENYAEKVQRLAVRRGWRCNLVEVLNEGRKTQYTLLLKKTGHKTIAGKNTPDCVLKGGRYKMPKFVEDKNYTGKLWCVTNELGSTIVRRNGKVLISGNCGRGFRIHDNKKDCLVIDCTNTTQKLGRVETIEITKEDDGFRDRVETNTGVATNKPLYSFQIKDKKKTDRFNQGRLFE